LSGPPPRGQDPSGLEVADLFGAGFHADHVETELGQAGAHLQPIEPVPVMDRAFMISLLSIT